MIGTRDAIGALVLETIRPATIEVAPAVQDEIGAAWSAPMSSGT